MTARVAAHDDAIPPVHFQGLGGDARRARMRVRTEIADAGMDVELAVRRQNDEAVKTAAARRMVGRAGADAGHFRAVALSARRFALLPIERGRPLGEGIRQVSARDGALLRAGL